MKEEVLDIAKKLYHNHLTPETATNLLLDLFAVNVSVCGACDGTKRFMNSTCSICKGTGKKPQADEECPGIDGITDYGYDGISTDANNVLATVFYKFFYKDQFGRMNNKVVEVNKKDSELAIAKFEKENPEIVWRSFIIL